MDPVWFLSAVGGGPLERLAASLRTGGQDARLVHLLDGAEWRRLMAAGSLGRAWARLRVMCIFPLYALGVLARGRGKVAVVSTNPFFLPLFLSATRWIHRKRVVALVYDLYPDALEGVGIARPGGLASRIGAGGNRLLFRRSQGVVFIGRQMGEHARRRYGEPRRWTVLETGAEPGEFEGREGSNGDLGGLRKWCGDALLLAYVGNLGPLHDWETLAAGIEPLARGPSASRIRFLFAASGSGIERLRERLQGLGDTVRFVDQLPDLEWAAVMRRVDVALVTLRSAAHRTSVPSKTFSAMAAGAAVLAVAPAESDLAEIVRSAACGLVVEPGDGPGFSGAVAGFLADPGSLAAYQAAATKAARERYGMAALARKWETFLEEVAAG
jgi:colanic acid biosynthesis glycosyl transferase WcaI